MAIVRKLVQRKIYADLQETQKINLQQSRSILAQPGVSFHLLRQRTPENSSNPSKPNARSIRLQKALIQT